MINRRSLITGLISLVAAPAIVRVVSIMPVRGMIEPPLVISFNRAYAVGDAVRLDGLYYVCTMAGVVSSFDTLAVSDRRADGLWWDLDYRPMDNLS